MALLDMIGVASIMPFIAVLSNPSLIETNDILNKIFQISGMFGVETNQQFLFALGIFVFLLTITSIAFKAFTEYMQYRFISISEYILSKRLVEGYLFQPYSWFLNRNSADLGKNVLSEVGTIVGGCMKPMMDLIAKSMVAIALLLLLFITDPKLSLIVCFSLGGAYLLIYKLSRSFLNYIGKTRFRSNQLRFTSLSEAFGAVKEIKVGGLEQIYIKQFSDPAKNFAKAQYSASVISQLPRHALEAIAFGGILLLILYLMNQAGTFASALPIITLYAYAGYRLMPALQNIYSSSAKLRYIGPTLNSLYEDFKTLKSIDHQQDQGILTLNKEITLNKIYYQYPNTSRIALNDINLKIPARKTIGLVGTTGSGKTTTVDIILGLLEVKQGTLEVDGKVINKKNCRAWQKSIGYVPQNIYLTDDTIKANIALGVNPNEINLEAIKKACKIANLHDFITNELPNQYETIVGERGVRLSGGQKQRIGIARA
ncbi:ABC transporter ATP-binding protein, partial [Candidatus Pelagibacter sp.]|nr:ABC transporter ATP-binding protein [Candidatus Pelagibacter sp.]